MTADDDFTPVESKHVLDEMDWQICSKKYLRSARLYCGQLMLSEWLLKDQIPSHLETDWILVGWYILKFTYFYIHFFCLLQCLFSLIDKKQSSREKMPCRCIQGITIQKNCQF